MELSGGNPRHEGRRRIRGHWKWFQFLCRALSDAVSESEVGLSFQCGDLSFHVAWQPCVIVVQETYITGLCERAASISAGAYAVMRDTHIPDAVPSCHLFGLVVGVVVDNDDLLRRHDERRSQNARYRHAQQARSVVRWNDDGDRSLVVDPNPRIGRHGHSFEPRGAVTQ